MTRLTANDRQVGGNHYKSTVQHWDFVIDHRMGYFEGQITKYLSRWRVKGGLQDLDKARHYMDKLLEGAENREIEPACWRQRRGGSATATVPAFCSAYHISTLTPFVYLLLSWGELSQLQLASNLLDDYIADAEGGEPQPQGYVNQD